MLFPWMYTLRGIDVYGRRKTTAAENMAGVFSDRQILFAAEFTWFRLWMNRSIKTKPAEQGDSWQWSIPFCRTRTIDFSVSRPRNVRRALFAAADVRRDAGRGLGGWTCVFLQPLPDESGSRCDGRGVRLRFTSGKHSGLCRRKEHVFFQ